MDFEEVKYIHEYLVEYFADSDDPVSPPGIKNKELLESAVARPFMVLGGQEAYKGVFNKAAALFHSVINNHCFHNGNKRSALLSTLAYLGDNGYWLTQATDEEMFEFTRKSAAHELSESRDDELSIIAEWFRKHSRRRQNKEQTLKFHELHQTLNGFGFELSDCEGGFMNVSKGGKVRATVNCNKGKNGKEDFDKQYIQRLRKKLKLIPAYGIDSYLFYGKKGFQIKLNEFMKIRHEVMRELAKI